MKKLLLSIILLLSSTYVLSVENTGYQRNVTIEEGTGTWCSWCVRGIVALQYMQTKYPDSFIGIAIHDNDAMTVAAYNSFTGFNNWPICNVDRTYMKQQVSSSSQLEDLYNLERAASTYGKIDVNAKFSSDQKAILINTSSVFSIDSLSACNVALVMLEDSVTGYAQKNAYSGGSYGVMGGYENKPDVIKDEVFNHVARGIYPNYYGATLCDSIKKNMTYTYNDSIEIPSYVQHNSKLSIVALLMNKNSGKIVNAAKYVLTGGMNGNPNSNGSGGDVKNDSTTSDSTNVGTHGHYQYVDLGLSVNWASGNILSASNDFGEGTQDSLGGYFGWADPTGLLMSTEASDYNKENTLSNISGSEYDIAHVKWGGDWRLPTYDEMKELVDNTTTKADTINNVPGLLFTSKINGNNMFMPANGSRYGNTYWDVHALGAYWTGTFSEDTTFGIAAHQLDFDDTGAHTTYVAELFNGFGVRPVFTVSTRVIPSCSENKTMMKIQYYTIEGVKIAKPSHGVYIEKIIYGDGTKRILKRYISQ